MKAGCCAIAGLLLSACVDTVAPQTVPLTRPLADGRAQAVRIGPQSFVVNRRALDQVGLRVTRVEGRDLEYSEGAIAKKAAEAYCAGFHRRLDPAAIGRFSLPNAWVFGGDCL